MTKDIWPRTYYQWQTIGYLCQKPKEKEYSSLAEREKDTRKTYETMFKNSGFSRTEKKRKVDEYVEKTMSVFK